MGFSGIAVHPKSKRYYVLSHRSKELLIFGEDEKLLKVIALDPKLFPQAEGICFSPEGTLFISTEATKKKKARILMFKPKQ